MKGAFLSPQNLQAQDRFIENLLRFQVDALNFRPWGFQQFRLDREELAGGNLALSQASGIFPDGLLFDIPNSDPAPPKKPLLDFFDPDQESCDVYLAIPHQKLPGVNVSLETGNVDTRYKAEAAMLRDENTGLSEKPVMVARKNFRLLAEGESRQGFSSIRVARVLKTPAGTLRLDPECIPPLLDIRASERLNEIARRLVEILAAKSLMLSGTRRMKNLSLADFGAADIASFWLLYTVNAHFPLIQHIFETRHGHPSGLYEAMLSLAGALSTFSLKIHPRDLPTYDHDNLAACFNDLDEKVRTLLETVVPSNFVSLPLKLIQPFIYGTALDQDKYLRNTRMYLAVSAEMSEAELIGKGPFLAKVCSANHIEHLVRHALPGVPLTHAPKPPTAIPVKLNYQYFSLNQSGAAWEAIQRARNLAVHLPGDFPNPNLELIILLPEAS